MRVLDQLTADRLLAVASPESLFTCSLHEAKAEYRQLVRIWHPDSNHQSIAPKVFSHIVDLYDRARRKLLDGSWKEPAEKIEQELPGLKRFRCVDGSIKSIVFERSRVFELGRSYISDHYVVYEVLSEYQDLFRVGRLRTQNLRFLDGQMAVEMASSLPQIVDVFKTADSSVLVVRKTPDQLLLADVLVHCRGRIVPIEHVGWILNVLYNLSCYFEWLGIAHNAISVDTVFVSPLRHSGMLLGGWWYAAPIGAELVALNDQSLAVIPEDIVRARRADGRADLESIKAVGRELLGDLAGASLLLDESLPRVLAEWLYLPSSGSATRDYADWKYEVLESAFGQPSFVNWNLDRKALYKEG
jgi:hypothetical protein